MVQKFISHRANLYKKDNSRENKIESIYDVVEKGFDCEIDLWCHNNELLLGHDRPIDKINFSSILELKNYLWIHCKNLESLFYLSVQDIQDLNYFWHQNDDFTLTSLNYIWTYPNKEITPRSVIVDLKHKTKFDKQVFGICSDNIYDVKKIYE